MKFSIIACLQFTNGFHSIVDKLMKFSWKISRPPSYVVFKVFCLTSKLFILKSNNEEWCIACYYSSATSIIMYMIGGHLLIK